MGRRAPRLAPIASAVAVDRLREVACLYGFTRFEAAPTATDGDLEELYLAVEGAALATELEWLPAVEHRGEGIFLRFDPDVIRDWLSRPAVLRRGDMLYRSWDRWRAGQFYGARLQFPRVAYYAIHGFSHALMNEIALDCGYPATALRNGSMRSSMTRASALACSSTRPRPARRGRWAGWSPSFPGWARSPSGRWTGWRYVPGTQSAPSMTPTPTPTSAR